MFDADRHGAEEVPYSDSGAMSAGEKSLLRQRWGVSSQDCGVVNAHGVVRVVVPMVRRDGQQRQRSNTGQEDAMFAMFVRLSRKLGGVYFEYQPYALDLISLRAHTQCSCPRPPLSLNSDGGIPMPLSSIVQFPRV